MAGIGTIGNVLNASTPARAAVNCSWYIVGNSWDDNEALIAVCNATNGDLPIEGDVVRLMNLTNLFGETRMFKYGKWDLYGWTATISYRLCPIDASRKGYQSWSDIGASSAITDAGYPFPIDGDSVTLYDDTWTQTRYYKDGKWVEDSLYFPGVLSVPSQPGIDDELKPNLPKRLRDW